MKCLIDSGRVRRAICYTWKEFDDSPENRSGTLSPAACRMVVGGGGQFMLFTSCLDDVCFSLSGRAN